MRPGRRHPHHFRQDRRRRPSRGTRILQSTVRRPFIHRWRTAVYRWWPVVREGKWPAIGTIAFIVLALIAISLTGPIARYVTLLGSYATEQPANATLVGVFFAFLGVIIAQIVAIFIAWWGRRHQQKIENQRTQDEALQRYLVTIGELLTDKGLLDPEKEEARTLAGAQTLATLGGLNPLRKRILLRFLYDSSLISKDKQVVISLLDANLSDVDLKNAHLAGAALEGVDLTGADLSGADLTGAKLLQAVLDRANLTDTYLIKAHLNRATLPWATLRGAHLIDAKLPYTTLWGTDLTEAMMLSAGLGMADMTGAKLNGTKLSKADLRGANLYQVKGLTQEQIEESLGDKATRLPHERMFDRKATRLPGRRLQRPKEWHADIDAQRKRLEG